ncbi:16S rRNA (cytosine(967)-C(5))-methyltransferase [Romeria aff. gracilis LEGE 07310]|uniref:16S rRNA (cytosine(967)-C(5))-methyltransferase n=1 Tax=Vasconcelosia minhoensis LEGE 07310 TaxID=915328 RepID=A0A8J7DMZ8_9CYAN|nr:16S rRNA (cytosine(967)-C(5))-methyltransferase [Romeria gracilis]MBE9077495.1 16S rRNA (cytosine(967)-C(5))-methyltransferase [Romeria aff. gracilis LEGE 07310]
MTADGSSSNTGQSFSSSTGFSARQLALKALRSIERGAFADEVVSRQLSRANLSLADKRLLTELVYGSVRRQRTLDALIGQFGKKQAEQQPTDLRLILRLGFYQLRYLSQVPPHAAIDTSVELAKQQRLGKLSGVVNGILRQYIRRQAAGDDPLRLPEAPIARLGIRHSYPDWIIQLWQTLLPPDEVESLCEWFNQPPKIDLRVNLQRSNQAQVEAALQKADVAARPIRNLPGGLRLTQPAGAIHLLPGYSEGEWSVQDSSAQLVGHLVTPQPGELIIDACAAPGGKSTHLAELMGDVGTVWACDRAPSRLKKIQQNLDRLRLKSVQPLLCDSRTYEEFGECDRLLLDVPCSGLGTLHRHADARWQQFPESVETLVQLQRDLLLHTATWVKPGGILVYSTCTLNPAENEDQILWFLSQCPNWQIQPPPPSSPAYPFAAAKGWIKVWPHRHDMDGFFMVKLQKE